MPARRALLLAGLVAGGLAFAAGLWWLGSLRFDAGDIYPPYSSLRRDPMGAALLYDSLGELSGVQTRRNYQPLDRLSLGEGDVLMVLGLTGATLDAYGVQIAPGQGQGDDDAERLASIAGGGARVVLSLAGDSPAPPWSLAGLGGQAGFTLAAIEPPPKLATLRDGPAGTDLERQLPWASRWYFAVHDPAWRVLYEAGGRAVIIERELDAGSLVVCADSRVFSNEALVFGRSPRLLSYVSAGRQVVFDETHLGVIEETNIASLARRYGLELLGGALAVVALLYVWKSSCSLVPHQPQPASETIDGAASSSTLVNLLQRCLPDEKLLEECISQWRADRTGRVAAGLDEQVDSVLAHLRSQPAGQRDVAQAYRLICQMVSERKRHGN